MKTEIELFVIERAKEFRIKNKLSQADLAFKMNLSVGFIGKVESKVSSTKYNLNHINKLAHIFNVSPKEFLPYNTL
ncbi:MAG: helix-turn-helix domain-containing protein [Bacteroidales bacterium]